MSQHTSPNPQPRNNLFFFFLEAIITIKKKDLSTQSSITFSEDDCSNIKTCFKDLIQDYMSSFISQTQTQLNTLLKNLNINNDYLTKFITTEIPNTISSNSNKPKEPSRSQIKDTIEKSANVFERFCQKHSVQFCIDDLEIVSNVNSKTSFGKCYNAMEKYVHNSSQLNHSLLCSKLSTNDKIQIDQIKEFMKGIRNTYDELVKEDDKNQATEQYIFHVGSMFYDMDGTPCVFNTTHVTRCFISCSLQILRCFLQEKILPVIYQIKVPPKMPLFFVFQNIEQKECLLPPNTTLKVIKCDLINHMDKQCIFVEMEIPA